MYIKKSHRYPYEIHLYAIDEGTGHLQRIYNLAWYLEKYFNNITIFIYNIYNNFYINKYIKKNNFKKTFRFINFFCNPIELSPKKTYILILDIRDHNPENILKNYQNLKYHVLCIDNHHKNKYPSFYYWYTLPHPDINFSLINLIYNNFWNPQYIKILNKKESPKENYVLIYLGFMDHTYIDFLKESKNIHFLLKSFYDINLSRYILHFIDKERYLIFNRFYELLQKSKVIITYPGLLLYESIILEKKVICYDLNSRIHDKILKQIQQHFNSQYIDKMYLNFHQHKLKFYYFDFSHVLHSFGLDIHEKLWTSYHQIKNWIENFIK